MRVNRFVLDANIWVSYLITETEQNIVDIIADNDLTVFRCDELLAEVARVLQYPRLVIKFHTPSSGISLQTKMTTI